MSRPPGHPISLAEFEADVRAGLNKPGQKELYYWQDLCRPYVKNEAVYSCPSQSVHTKRADKRPRGGTRRAS